MLVCVPCSAPLHSLDATSALMLYVTLWWSFRQRYKWLQQLSWWLLVGGQDQPASKCHLWGADPLLKSGPVGLPHSPCWPETVTVTEVSSTAQTFAFAPAGVSTPGFLEALGVVIKQAALRDRLPGRGKYLLCSCWPRANSLAFLDSCSLLWKMRVTVVATSQNYELIFIKHLK